MITQYKTAVKYFTKCQSTEMPREVIAEVDLVNTQTQNER